MWIKQKQLYNAFGGINTSYYNNSRWLINPTKMQEPTILRQDCSFSYLERYEINLCEKSPLFGLTLLKNYYYLFYIIWPCPSKVGVLKQLLSEQYHLSLVRPFSWNTLGTLFFDYNLSKMILVYKRFSLNAFVLCNLLLLAFTKSWFSQRSISAVKDSIDNYSNEMT